MAYIPGSPLDYSGGIPLVFYSSEIIVNEVRGSAVENNGEMNDKMNDFSDVYCLSKSHVGKNDEFTRPPCERGFSHK